MYAALLRRNAVLFDLKRLRSFYRGKRVLVTGAAGSIGSALCKTLAELGCTKLAILDHSDHGLLAVSEAIAKRAPHLELAESLCDIRDEARLTVWMRRVKPDLVIHAAALKHVHVGEAHPDECVLTNLVGARNAVRAAMDAGAQRFVLISSDKAAAPGCVMGATKRLAELYLRGLEMEHGRQTQLRSVRFGNVLGSQGSVLPRLEAQIASGGPLEITHPDMQRYFMSSDEAVGLILSIAALDPETDANGAAYFMDMGELVSITDLARDLAQRLGREVPIKITGLRPGEKLKEQLFDDYEETAATILPNVFRVTPKAASGYVTSSDIAALESSARTMMEAPIVRQRVFAQLDNRLGRTDLLTG